MAATAFVRARIDGALKDGAATVLAGMGLTVSDLVRFVLTKVAKEKALRFEMRGKDMDKLKALTCSMNNQKFIAGGKSSSEVELGKW